MLFYLGVSILIGHAFALATGYVVSGMLYPNARIELLPDGITPGVVIVDGLGATAIVIHFLGLG